MVARAIEPGRNFMSGNLRVALVSRERPKGGKPIIRKIAQRFQHNRERQLDAPAFPETPARRIVPSTPNLMVTAQQPLLFLVGSIPDRQVVPREHSTPNLVEQVGMHYNDVNVRRLSKRYRETIGI